MKQNEQKEFEPSEAREELCCCQSKLAYQDCCKPYHAHQRFPATAEALMRSRYSAYVLHLVDYIVETTVPAKQSLLNKVEIGQWSSETHWLGLDVHFHRLVGKKHAQVEFTAHWQDANG